MKKSIVILFVLIGFTLSAQNTKIEVLKQFLKSEINFENASIDLGQPIASISELAKDQAAETIALTKDNIKDVLQKAKEYKSCYIIVGVHSIVKITNLEDCSPSGVWGTCMPKGKGYVQRAGVLNEKVDYIKNIIGRPDSQMRNVFLFK